MFIKNKRFLVTLTVGYMWKNNSLLLIMHTRYTLKLYVPSTNYAYNNTCKQLIIQLRVYNGILVKLNGIQAWDWIKFIQLLTTHAHAYTRTHTHTHIHARAHTHTHTHTYTLIKDDILCKTCIVYSKHAHTMLLLCLNECFVNDWFIKIDLYA